MKTLGHAIALAAKIHADQTDKAGEDYILHPLAVMRMVAPDRTAMIVGVLHDTVEDSGYKGVDLLALWRDIGHFGTEVWAAIDCLTHRDNESYAEYIEHVATNYYARVVKIADLTHNMDPRRIPAYQIIDKDFDRWAKYRRALIRLERDD